MKTFLEILDIIGYGTSVIVVIAFFVGVYRWFMGISPALLRLGEGLANRKIAIFAEGDNFNSIKSLLIDSKLFKERNYYILLLQKFKEILKLYPTSIFAYCLMPNHFHFMLRQDSDKPIYKNFNNLFSYYVQVFNFKYKRQGTIFNGPLQHKIITTEKYLTYICQYIHLNPVKAGLVKNHEDWEFSNYQEWIGKRKGTLLCDELLKEYFGKSEDYQKSIKEFNNLKKDEKFIKLLFDDE